MPALDVSDVVYHAGGATHSVTATEIAAANRASLEDVDVPLADAVAQDLLDRGHLEDTGELCFSLAPAGFAFVETASQS